MTRVDFQSVIEKNVLSTSTTIGLKDFEVFKKIGALINENNEKGNEITSAFLPFLKVMQWTGIMPFKVNKIGKLARITYKPFSVASIFCWTQCVLQIFVILCLILNREFNLDWPIHMYDACILLRNEPHNIHLLQG
jgi:hypothetical protein